MAQAPQTQEEFGRRHLELLGRIIDKAASDPAWKEKLLADPQTAFDEAGLLPEIDSLNPALWDEGEVKGQVLGGIGMWTVFPCTMTADLIRRTRYT